MTARLQPPTPTAPDPKDSVAPVGSARAIRKLIGATKSAPTISCTEEENLTRPEFTADADINTLLRRYGAMTPVQQLESGTYDYDIEFADTVAAARAANEAWQQLPSDVQERYKNIPGLMAAIDRGELKHENRAGRRGSNTRATDVKPKPERPPKAEGANA